MNSVEIRAAINFGKAAIQNYKKNGEAVPSFVYERIIELYEQLAEALA